MWFRVAIIEYQGVNRGGSLVSGGWSHITDSGYCSCVSATRSCAVGEESCGGGVKVGVGPEHGGRHRRVKAERGVSQSELGKKSKALSGIANGKCEMLKF